jgi:hypothetical protein
MITVDFHRSLMLNMTKNQPIHTIFQNHGCIIHTSLLTYEVVVMWNMDVPMYQINVTPTVSILKIIRTLTNMKNSDLTYRYIIHKTRIRSHKIMHCKDDLETRKLTAEPLQMWVSECMSYQSFP